MYIEVGAFDAKAKLSQLLQEVKRGRCYTITVRGRPIADLIPSERNLRKNTHQAIESMRTIRKVKGVTTKTLTEWISEGRR